MAPLLHTRSRPRLPPLLTTSHRRENCPIARLFLARYVRNIILHVTGAALRVFDREPCPAGHLGQATRNRG
jgi:hypothetical protein